MFRTLKIARARRDWQPPAGTTHVLQWLPCQLLSPEDRKADVTGWWEIQDLGSFLSGEPAPIAEVDGPASLDIDALQDIADAQGLEVAASFGTELEISGEGFFISPAHWLTPAA